MWVVEENGCWIWQGTIDQDGYGRYRANGQDRLAHRVAYENVYGPTKYPLHHLCHERKCMRPDHLQSIDAATHNILHHSGRHTNYPKDRKPRCKWFPE